jgi:hypothetical protein
LKIDKEIYSKIEFFNKQFENLGKEFFKNQNVLNKVIFVGSRIYSVNKDGELKPKFTENSFKNFNFNYFPELNIQLAILFDSQMKCLTVVVDLYFQMIKLLNDHEIKLNLGNPNIKLKP